MIQFFNLKLLATLVASIRADLASIGVRYEDSKGWITVQNTNFEYEWADGIVHKYPFLEKEHRCAAVLSEKRHGGVVNCDCDEKVPYICEFYYR